MRWCGRKGGKRKSERHAWLAKEVGEEEEGVEEKKNGGGKSDVCEARKDKKYSFEREYASRQFDSDRDRAMAASSRLRSG